MARQVDWEKAYNIIEQEKGKGLTQVFAGLEETEDSWGKIWEDGKYMYPKEGQFSSVSHNPTIALYYGHRLQEFICSEQTTDPEFRSKCPEKWVNNNARPKLRKEILSSGCAFNKSIDYVEVHVIKGDCPIQRELGARIEGEHEEVTCICTRRDDPNEVPRCEHYGGIKKVRRKGQEAYTVFCEAAEKKLTNHEGMLIKYQPLMKIADCHRFLSVEQLQQLEDIIETIEEGRASEGKSTNRVHLVINTDEPYADQVIDILKTNGHWG